MLLFLLVKVYMILGHMLVLYSPLDQYQMIVTDEEQYLYLNEIVLLCM